MQRLVFHAWPHSARQTDVAIFESVQEQMDEAAKFATAHQNGYSGFDYNQYVNCWNRPAFVGREFNSHADVKQAVNSEWTEGLDTIERMVHSITTHAGKPKSVRRRPRFDEQAGDEVDLDRLRSGQPYWRECHRDSAVQVRTVTIFADITTPGVFKWQDVMWRGAAALALAYKLEEAGYRTEIWTVNGSEVDYNNRPVNGFILTNLKRTSEPMDLSTLINSVSSWFYRTMTFCTKAALAKGRKIDEGYGNCCRGYSEVLDTVSTDPNRICIEHIWDEDEATRFVDETLKAFN